MVVKKGDSSCVKSKVAEIQLENEVGLGKCMFINLSVIILLCLVVLLLYLMRELWKTGSLEKRGRRERSIKL